MGYQWEYRPFRGGSMRGDDGRRVQFELDWPNVILTRHDTSYTVNVLTFEVQRFKETDTGCWDPQGNIEHLASGETIGNALDRLARQLCDEVQDA